MEREKSRINWNHWREQCGDVIQWWGGGGEKRREEVSSEDVIQQSATRCILYSLHRKSSRVAMFDGEIHSLLLYSRLQSAIFLTFSLSPRDVTFRFSYTFVLPHRVKSILVARKHVSPSIARESIFLIIMDLRKSCLIESDLLKSENKILSSSSSQGEHCIYRNRLLEREWFFLLCPGLNQDSPNFRKHMCWIINAPDVIKSYLHSLATLLFLEPSQFAWKCAPIAKIANFCFTEIHIASE